MIVINKSVPMVHIQLEADEVQWLLVVLKGSNILMDSHSHLFAADAAKFAFTLQQRILGLERQ